MRMSTVLSNHGLRTRGGRGLAVVPACPVRYRARGSTAAERPRNGCGRCQCAGAFLCAAAATARATASPARAPLDQSDEEGAHRVVDLHEAPRHPSVDASGRSGLLRRRIFPCGQHRVPDHLRERGPPLARTNHRLQRWGCLGRLCYSSLGPLSLAGALCAKRLPLSQHSVHEPQNCKKLGAGGGTGEPCTALAARRILWAKNAVTTAVSLSVMAVSLSDGEW